MNFLRECIRALSEEMDEPTKDRMRARLHGKSERDQLKLMVEEAMRTYAEPAYLKARREAEEAGA